MDLISGQAHHESPLEMSGAPYPLVLFSHGFQGVHFQSFTFTEYLASHGYVVAAPSHEGNTMLDFNASDEQVAQVALERPVDLRFAYDQMMSVAGGDGPLSGIVAPGKVAVSGHSFGGYTALIAAGGVVDVDEATAACAAGTPSDLFCPYIGFWPAGAVVGLDPPIPGVSAAIYLAPGGEAAFGGNGLDTIGVPGFVFGGTLDHMTTLEDEIDPIYEGLPAPKLRGIVTDAGHMSFTNICAIPSMGFFLEDFCGVEGLKEAEETFAVVNPLAVAFLHYTLKDDAAMVLKLDPGVAEATYPDLSLESEGMP
jgi:predicted dienelactone hydrolase